jgi:hypothetical protein
MKKLLQFNLLLLFFIPISSIAQTAQFTQVWNDKYRHTAEPYFASQSRKVAVDSVSGWVYMLADETSDLNPSGVVTGSTYSYISLLKYDDQGTLLDVLNIDVAQHTITNFEQRSSFGMELDASGNIYIAYNSYNATTNYDVNIAKYNSNLALQWLYKFNPSTIDLGIDFKLSANGTAYALLKSNSGGNDRPRIIKATGNGITTSALYTFTGFADVFSSMTLDHLQNVYVTGYRLISGNIKVASTAAVNSGGTLLWRRTDNFGNATGNHFSRYITYGADSSIYITGSSQGTVQHGIDAFLMKLGPQNGKLIWQQLLNFNLNDGGYFVSAREAGMVFLMWIAGNSIYFDQVATADGTLGRRAVYSPTPSAPYNSLNGITISDYKVSNAGLLYFTGTVSANASNGDIFTTAFVSKLNYVARANSRFEYQFIEQGTTSISAKGVALALDNSSNKVYWVFDTYDTYYTHKYEFASIRSLMGGNGSGIFRDASALSNTENFSFDMYPIPAHDKLTVNSKTDLSQFEMIDLTGKVVIKIQNSEGAKELQIDLQNLSSGVYLAKCLSTNGFVETRKVIKY